jgi:O-antigen/teichoic acid export membrane protein
VRDDVRDAGARGPADARSTPDGDGPAAVAEARMVALELAASDGAVPVEAPTLDSPDSPDFPDPASTGAPAQDAAPPQSRRSVFTGGAWSAASTVLPMGSTVALSVVISRALGPELLGEQSLVAYVASLMTSVVIYSFTAASVQLLASAGGARDEQRLAYLALWSHRAHVVGGAFAAAVLVSGGLTRDHLQTIWFIAAATAFCDALGWASASRHIAAHGWAGTGARRLVAQAASPILGIAAIAAGFGIDGVFAAQLVTSVVLLGFLHVLDRRDPVISRAGVAPPDWRPVMRIWSLFALSTLITQIVERRIELVFLDHYYDGREIAMYSVAFNVVGIAIMICVSLISASIPAIAASYGASLGHRVEASFSRGMRVVVTMGLLLSAAAISIGPHVVTALWGPEYGMSGTLVRWLGITLLLAPAGALANAYWTGTGRMKPVILAGSVGAVLDIGLAATLIPHHGAGGAVVASLVGQGSASFLIVGYTMRSGLHIDVHGRRLGLAALAAVLAGGAGYGGGLAGGWLGLLGSLAAYGVVLAGVSRVLGLFDDGDVDWLAETLPGPAGRLVRRFSPTPAAV